MLTVAQLVELQIVVLVVVSSILICQPKGEVVHWQAQLTVNQPSNDCASSTLALPTTNRKSNEYRQNNVVVNRDSNHLLVIVYP